MSILIKITKHITLLILLIIANEGVMAQTRISNGGVPTAANADAILELTSTANNKGLLIARVALTATNAAAPLSAHVAGMLVYNTATAGTAPNNVTPGMYLNNGSSWVRVVAKSPGIGDIKYSFSASDHNGWYILDGRAKTTLPANAQTNATNLGFGTNIPNAADRMLKAKTGAEVIGSTGGSNSFTIAQANLPNVNFNASVSAVGDHTHTYTSNNSGSVNVRRGSANDMIADTSTSNMTTSTDGDHSHTYTVSTGGSGTAVSYTPAYIVGNVFIYLGN